MRVLSSNHACRQSTDQFHPRGRIDVFLGLMIISCVYLLVLYVVANGGEDGWDKPRRVAGERGSLGGRLPGEVRGALPRHGIVYFA